MLQPAETRQRLDALEAAANNACDPVERELIVEMAARYRDWCVATGKLPVPFQPRSGVTTLRCKE